MTKEEYGDFVLRYKGCGACFPMYHTLSRFEKMWFTAIQKDVAELEKENKTVSRKANEAIADKLLITDKYNEVLNDLNQENGKLQKENAELRADNEARKFAMAMSEKVEKQLREENAELKKMYHESDEDNNKLRENIPLLAEAKEIIKSLLRLWNDVMTEETVKALIAEAEQFISEVKK